MMSIDYELIKNKDYEALGNKFAKHWELDVQILELSRML